MAEPESILQCPVCRQPLRVNDTGLYCDHGHQFDRARQGYVNLLLVQQKKSRQPGDDKQMVQARSRFLETGRYQPLADQLLKATDKFWPDVEHWVDLGCGEGWYSQQLRKSHPNADGYGLDISKQAIQAACKRSNNLTWLVASAANTPFQPQSLEGATVLFSGIYQEELLRILKPGAILLTIGTDSEHLLSLRQKLYPEVRQSEYSARRYLSERFSLEYEKEVKFEWIPDSEQELNDLLTMTPHHWRVSPEQKSKINELINLPMIAHFRIQVWQLDSAAG
jgi:23S rRNA (guanine745-N1)-methyltransferase